MDEDDQQRPNVNNLLHRWRDILSSVVQTFRIDRSQNNVAPPVADPTDCLNRVAAAEAAVQQAAEAMPLAVKRGQLILVVLLAQANPPASAIERQAVAQPADAQLADAQLADAQPADAQPADAQPANQAVRAHAPQALEENVVVSHQVHRKANVAAKDDGRNPRQLDRKANRELMISKCSAKIINA